MSCKKFLKKVIMLFSVIVCMCVLAAVYCQLPMFGKTPQGRRLTRIEKSPNYNNGSFRNTHNTSVMVGNPFRNMYRFMLPQKNLKPLNPLPSIKTDLKNLNPREDVMVWFGHSSFFFQISGKRILVDPVFSDVSSPMLFFPKAFAGTNIYGPKDMPEIDYLIITHNHWDHLDYQTIIAMKEKIQHVVCPLGVGETLEYWGFLGDHIDETDWWDEVECSKDLKIYCLPARHFSGRGFLRNKTLWASFMFQTNNMKIYISGDSGYDNHFKEIEAKFGPVDIAILDSGQHDPDWRYIHMLTPEVIKAARDLKTKVLIPDHICKLSLANHAWNEPLNELVDMMKNEKFSMLVPMIGEKVKLKGGGAELSDENRSDWWVD